MEGYGGTWNQWSARPEGPMWARGSQRAPLVPYPPISLHIPPQHIYIYIYLYTCIYELMNVQVNLLICLIDYFIFIN